MKNIETEIIELVAFTFNNPDNEQKVVTVFEKEIDGRYFVVKILSK